MTGRAANKGSGKYTLALLRRAQDAQRHHNLTFTLVAEPTQDVRRALAYLTRLGLLTHVRVGEPSSGGGRGPREITCTLRYWEGAPLVSIVATPNRMCSYHDLARRAAQGGGGAMLLWSQGRLRTGSECLALRYGGFVVAALAA